MANFAVFFACLLVVSTAAQCGGNISPVDGWCCKNSATTFIAPQINADKCSCPGDICVRVDSASTSGTQANIDIDQVRLTGVETDKDGALTRIERLDNKGGVVTFGSGGITVASKGVPGSAMTLTDLIAAATGTPAEEGEDAEVDDADVDVYTAEHEQGIPSAANRMGIPSGMGIPSIPSIRSGAGSMMYSGASSMNMRSGASSMGIRSGAGSMIRSGASSMNIRSGASSMNIRSGASSMGIRSGAGSMIRSGSSSMGIRSGAGSMMYSGASSMNMRSGASSMGIRSGAGSMMHSGATSMNIRSGASSMGIRSGAGSMMYSGASSMNIRSGASSMGIRSGASSMGIRSGAGSMGHVAVFGQSTASYHAAREQSGTISFETAATSETTNGTCNPASNLSPGYRSLRGNGRQLYDKTATKYNKDCAEGYMCLSDHNEAGTYTCQQAY